VSAVCVIPARGGSRRIPRKNIKPFHGKPIIAYSIEVAKESGLFDEIWISTDDPEIVNIASVGGVSFSWREAALCADDVGTQEVTKAMLERLNELGASFDYACCIYPCAPMMIAEDLRIGFRALTDPRAQTDFAYSVGMNPFRDAGNWYWGKTQSFLDGVPLDPDGFNIMKVVISNERVCDINTPEDWSRAEAMYAALHPEVA
jgi:N-acylneuraminate cytidylyltransferase